MFLFFVNIFEGTVVHQFYNENLETQIKWQSKLN